jgi:hypothetical protein
VAQQLKTMEKQKGEKSRKQSAAPTPGPLKGKGTKPQPQGKPTSAVVATGETAVLTSPKSGAGFDVTVTPPMYQASDRECLKLLYQAPY